MHRLEATTEIARAVGGETDLDRILEIVVKRGRALVEARSLLILLRDGDELVAGLDRRRARRTASAEARIPIAGSIPGQVLEARAPRRVHDLDPSLMARPGSQEAGVTALLVPLLFRGQALGVLVALDPLGRDAGFSDEDEQVLRLLCRQRRDRGGDRAVGRRRTHPRKHRRDRARARPLGARAARRVAAEPRRAAGAALRRAAQRPGGESSGCSTRGSSRSTARSPRCAA